jgi:hypothetical protein
MLAWVKTFVIVVLLWISTLLPAADVTGSEPETHRPGRSATTRAPEVCGAN